MCPQCDHYVSLTCPVVHDVLLLFDMIDVIMKNLANEKQRLHAYVMGYATGNDEIDLLM